MTPAVPLALRLVLGLCDVALGACLALLGALGVRGWLPRAAPLGVRTSASLADGAHFTLANRVAGGPWLVAGAIGLATGALTFLVPGSSAVLTVGILGLLAALGLAGAAAVLGHRAAEALPAPACGGCACAGAGCPASRRAS